MMVAELENIESCINFLIEASAIHRVDNNKTKIATSAGYNNKQEESKEASSA